MSILLEKKPPQKNYIQNELSGTLKKIESWIVEMGCWTKSLCNKDEFLWGGCHFGKHKILGVELNKAEHIL